VIHHGTRASASAHYRADRRGKGWPAGRRVWRRSSLHTLRMDRNEYRDEDDESPPDAYWRRRVITLALGLGLLGILAWGASGGGGAKSPSSDSTLLPATALGTAIPGLPGLASPSSPAKSGMPAPQGTSSAGLASGMASAGTASPGLATPTAVRSLSSPRPSVRPSPAAGVSATAVPSGGACPPGSVVLSLFTDRPSYGPGESPVFDVYAVSTSAGSCTFDPGQLQVVVMSDSRIIWDSADCGHTEGQHVANLARGVPAQASITWDRSITLPGCQVLAASTRAGSYQVQARTATVASPVRAFKLTG
jgi:hypothetical protein